MGIEDKTNDPAEQARHEQMIADSKPLESPEAAQAAFEELAAEITGETPPAKPAGFGGGTGGSGAPASSPPPTQSPAPTTAPASTSPPAPQLTAEDIEGLRQLPNAVKMLGGRVAKMQGDMEKLGKGAAASVAADGGAAPTAAAIAAAAGDTAKWSKLAKDFPEWGEAIEERLSAVAGAKPGAPVDIEAIRTQAKEEARAEAQAILDTQREADIAEEHANWKATLKAPEFKAWYFSQPEADRNKWWNSNSARSIVGMLDKFEASRQQSNSTAQANPSAASTAPTADLAAAVTKRGGSAIPAPSESDLDGRALWDHLAAKETAKT